MSNSPNLNLPYLAASQAQKHVTVNEALRILDALCNLTIIDRNLTVAPGSPSEGDCYIVADSATGDWSGHDREIAFFVDNGWQFVEPRAGWKAFIVDELAFVYWSTAASPDNWVDMPGYGGSSVIVSKDGTPVGTRGEVNLLEGSNIALTVADNTGDGRVDVTVSFTGTVTASLDVTVLAATATTGTDLLLFGDASDSDTLKKRTIDDLIADAGLALASHNHDASYAAIGHDHDGDYAALAHDHDASYAAFAHDHDADYAALDSDNDFGGFALSNYVVPKAVKTASYELTAADSGSVIEVDHASGATLTLPNGLPIGFVCEVAQVGAGAVTFAAGSGATLRHRQSHTKTAGQWAVAAIRVRANAGGSAAEAILSGDTAS